MRFSRTHPAVPPRNKELEVRDEFRGCRASRNMSRALPKLQRGATTVAIGPAMELARLSKSDAAAVLAFRPESYSGSKAALEAVVGDQPFNDLGRCRGISGTDDRDTKKPNRV